MHKPEKPATYIPGNPGNGSNEHRRTPHVIDAYPLSWPAGWPRVQAAQRKNARFTRSERQYNQGGGSWLRHKSISVADGIERVLAELQRFRVDRQDVVISTNIPIRLDGLPRSGVSEPKDPGAAVYWKQRGDKAPKVMAVDLYDRTADNLAAIAATLEAMRAIERHGGAQILDRAFTGFAALPAPVATRHWRDVFGYASDETVTADDLLQRYRRLASTTHPDKGGPVEAFQELERAFADASLGLVD